MERLWSFNFVRACLANFLLFFAFYLLIPVFPLYLIDTFGATKSTIGIVLSSYTIAALLIRPFSGFVLDMAQRKPLYLTAFFVFVMSFVSYPLALTIGMFMVFRILHGFAFGFVTTAGNSLVVDILPASRRGEGLGFFGVANNLAMVVGPMTGLLMQSRIGYPAIFYTAIASGLAGFGFAVSIKVQKIEIVRENVPLALDRFFLMKGIQAGITLMLIGIPYGMFITYLAVYGKELGIQTDLGFFFSLLAVGLIGSRLFSGKMVDRGKLTNAIEYGLLISVAGMILLASLQRLMPVWPAFAEILFLIIPVILGIGYGLTFPAYNTLFMNLAPHNRRATASSTFMTSWDTGVGAGLVLGGSLGDTEGGLALAFGVGGLLIVFSYVLFHTIAGPHFKTNKLR
ncbi:MAG: MFS transporter [Bacteroidales bacterium]|nr:MFS transporter [Bacteroidales bacterium]OJX90687.1 MAG: MFS transporter [Paludibacter sp. 47-17]